MGDFSIQDSRATCSPCFRKIIVVMGSVFGRLWGCCPWHYVSCCSWGAPGSVADNKTEGSGPDALAFSWEPSYRAATYVIRWGLGAAELLSKGWVNPGPRGRVPAKPGATPLCWVSLLCWPIRALFCRLFRVLSHLGLPALSLWPPLLG